MRRHLLDRPFFYRWTLRVSRLLPASVLYGFARLVGAIVFVCSRRDRRNVQHNLGLVFADRRPPTGWRCLLWRFFQNYAFYMVDFFRLLSMELGESKSFARLFEGRHNLDAALAQGRGVILLTAHLGHWEIGGLGLRALGYPLAVVTIRHNSVFTNRLINTLRSRHGIRVIELGDSPFDTIEIVRALNDQAVVAMLGDRAFSERSAPATFFGREVQLPVGPILLAMATGSPVVPAFSVMKAPGQYLGIIEPALNLRNGPEREDALRHNLQQVVAVFERYIRRYPDQWFQIDPM